MDLEGVLKAITVKSSSVDLSDAFRDHAQQAIARVVAKYFGRLNTASVHVGREGSLFRCTVNVQMGALKMMSAEAQDKDCYAAFKIALEKVEKQLRRAKRELREDKAVRVDKDRALQDGLRRAPSP
ncbi:MAG TPA: ribosome-associated translation inhibitor RaiA [Microvirga sp.]|nr:ribosome-associated translation inhibitor RaiA [Microvirga sp.]